MSNIAANGVVFLFGVLVGYLLHFFIKRDANPTPQDLVALIGAIVSAAVINAIGSDHVYWYLAGIVAGYVIYWLLVRKWLTPDRINEHRQGKPLPLFPF